MSNSISNSTDIEQVFGDLIDGSNIVCSVQEFKKGFKQLKKMIETRNINNDKKPRKQSCFFKWLNSDDRRSSIKDEYFENFDAWEDWSEEGIKRYYEEKNLPVDKLIILIEKKKNDGKEIKKPRIMSLINLKAGLIWSEMSETEKDNWKDVDNINPKESLDSENISVQYETIPINSSKGKAKKGRPAGYKPKNYTSESLVQQVIENIQTANDEEVELEEIVINGESYLKDTNDTVYDMECKEIGKLKNDKEIEFN